MADWKVAEEWLKKADEDFLFAKASLEDGLEFYSPIYFTPIFLVWGLG